METFKKALKQAILEKAEAVRFEGGQVPALLSSSQEKALQPLGLIDHQNLLELIDAIVPPNPSSPSTIREGSISIVNFGEVKLLASTAGPMQLYAFIPPQGTLSYLQMKTQLTENAQKAPSRAVSLQEDEFSQSSKETTVGRADFSLTQAPQYKTAAVVPAVSEPEIAGSIAAANLEVATLPPGSPIEEKVFELKTAFMKRVEASPASPLAAESDAKPFDNLTTLYVPTPPPIAPASPAGDALTATPYFEKAEDTQTDDYHFRPTSRLETGTRTEAAFPSPLDTTVTPPKSDVIIVFGPHLPGEVLADSGRKPIDALLETMVKQRASDLHLTMNEPPCVRVDGEIARMSQERLSEEQMRSFLLPIMPERNREEFAASHDTDFAYDLPGVARFRINMFRDRMGVGAVLRQIPDRILSADELGLAPAIRKLCELQKGLVIVTGPTGSGKSTTLASMIDLINDSRSDHILTIEDPIEFVHPQKRCLINQREVHRHTRSFSRALRAALREDPDIILIGELRDLETVEIAIETAETGHLVFGTLHTNTAISTIDRLIDQFSAEQQEQVRVMLAESLKGVIAQTLIKKKGGGRIAAQEILIVDRAVSALIREGNTHMVQNQMQTQKAKGNVLLNDALLNLVSKGLIEAKDAYAKAIDKEGLLAMLQQKGIVLEGLKTAS